MSRRLSPAQEDALHVRLRRERLARYRKTWGTGQVRWIAICDGRTCEDCHALNGQRFDLRDPRWPQLLRVHAGCRCRFTMEAPDGGW